MRGRSRQTWSDGFNGTPWAIAGAGRFHVGKPGRVRPHLSQTIPRGMSLYREMLEPKPSDLGCSASYEENDRPSRMSLSKVPVVIIRQVNRDDASRMLMDSLALHRLNAIKNWRFGTNYTCFRRGNASS